MILSSSAVSRRTSASSSSWWTTSRKVVGSSSSSSDACCRDDDRAPHPLALAARQRLQPAPVEPGRVRELQRIAPSESSSSPRAGSAATIGGLMLITFTVEMPVEAFLAARGRVPIPRPERCPACGHDRLTFAGLGTRATRRGPVDIQRAACAGCAATHSCWPDVLVGRRVDLAEMFGVAAPLPHARRRPRHASAGLRRRGRPGHPHPPAGTPLAVAVGAVAAALAGLSGEPVRPWPLRCASPAGCCRADQQTPPLPPAARACLTGRTPANTRPQGNPGIEAKGRQDGTPQRDRARQAIDDPGQARLALSRQSPVHAPGSLPTRS